MSCTSTSEGVCTWLPIDHPAALAKEISVSRCRAARTYTTTMTTYGSVPVAHRRTTQAKRHAACNRRCKDPCQVRAAAPPLALRSPARTSTADGMNEPAKGRRFFSLSRRSALRTPWYPSVLPGTPPYSLVPLRTPWYPARHAKPPVGTEQPAPACLVRSLAELHKVQANLQRLPWATSALDLPSCHRRSNAKRSVHARTD